MTYEEAVDPANASPYDKIFAWRLLDKMGYAGEQIVRAIVVPLDEPTWYQVCPISRDTNAGQLQMHLNREPYATLFHSTPAVAGSWEVGTLDELVRSAKSWRLSYEV